MEKWYVKSTAGKVFGPIDLESLKGWVRDGRIEPLAGISSDLKNWILAPMKPELEMDWVVENEPGQFYGPTHRAVLDDLVKSKALSPAARFFQDDRGAAAGRIKALEAAVAERDAAIQGLKAALEEREAAMSEMHERLTKAMAPHAREWSTDVIVPEVVADEPPPPVVRQAFGGDTLGRNAMLADLERRAQEELARMGAARATRFFKAQKQ